MDFIRAAVEKHRRLILDTEKYIWENPETGYKETKTNAYMADVFKRLGYELRMADGITGFTADINTGKPGATILIMGELDSVICPNHPESDKLTGAVHSCGHHAQCAALVGIAAALKEPEISERLTGTVRLCAVPAEELLEIEYRMRLREEGVIKYFGGKPEFLSRGYFDGVDIAFMVHTSTAEIHLTKGSVGCRVKKIIYKGKAAHAGGSPWNGVNALYAATCGLNAVNAIRETFKDSDCIRFHPIVTHGGAMVNAIPERAEIETYVRGMSFEAIDEANKRVNRALTGAALSLGANIEIIDSPGYAPHINAAELIELTANAAALVLPEHTVTYGEYNTGSTDNGDLSAIMPIIQPYCGGAVGTSHGSDYYIKDKELACLGSATLQIAMLLLLCADNGKRAKEIKASYKPLFASKEAYLAYLDSLNTSGDRIEYRNDGTASVTVL